MRQSEDVAELLVSTAGIVGDDRAIAAAQRGIGSDALVATLPVIQPGALSPDLRTTGRRARKDLKKRLGDGNQTHFGLRTQHLPSSPAIFVRW